MLLKAIVPDQNKSEEGDGTYATIFESWSFQVIVPYTEKKGKCSLWLAATYGTTTKRLRNTVLWFWWEYSGLLYSFQITHTLSMRTSKVTIAVSHATCSAQYCHPHKLATWIIKALFFSSKNKTAWAQALPRFKFSSPKQLFCVITCAVKNLKEELKSEWLVTPTFPLLHKLIKTEALQHCRMHNE